MIYYLRECADGTLLMLDKAGRVNVVLLDMDDAVEQSEELEPDADDEVLVEDLCVPTAA